MEKIQLNSEFYNNDPKAFNMLLENLYTSLQSLESEYEGFEDWFFKKVKPGLIKGNRNIVIKTNDCEIVAVSILKKDLFERKICTFRVFDNYKGLGIGTSLMKESLKLLGTNHPLITVSSLRHSEFKILKNFDFRLCDIYQDYYKKGLTEYSYNGELKPVVQTKLALF